MLGLLSRIHRYFVDPYYARIGIITELEEGFRYWFDDVEVMPIIVISGMCCDGQLKCNGRDN